MKKVLLAIMVTLTITLVAFSSVFAEETAFALAVSVPDAYKNGDTISVVITVEDITLTGGMSYVSFRLYYDTEKVKPVIKNGFNEEADNRTTFITKCPDLESWEVVGVLDEAEGYYELTFGTADVFLTKLAKNDGDLIFTIPFKAALDSTGDILFTLPDEYVAGGNKDLSEIEMKGKVKDAIVPEYSYAASSEYSDEINSDMEASDANNDTSNTEIDYLALSDNATVTISDGYLLGLKEKMTINQIKSMFKRNVTVSGTGTGATVSAGGHTVIIIVRGDISGDGKIDGKDYLFAKRSFMRTLQLSKVQLKAGCLGGTAAITANDYLKIKRHFLGSYNIFV